MYRQLIANFEQISNELDTIEPVKCQYSGTIGENYLKPSSAASGFLAKSLNLANKSCNISFG